MACHKHKEPEIYYFISGHDFVEIDGKKHAVEPGSTAFIPGDSEHGIFSEGTEELRWFFAFAVEGFGDILFKFKGEDYE
jgi:mannose-6-phosphate isomerase-like protein (cupin superfamily)